MSESPNGQQMSDDICPHCGHAWDLHLTRCLGPTGIHCGCQWTKPKPPPKPKTDHELFVDQVAGTIFSAVREHCDGYTDEYGRVDGEVDFSAVADAVIRELADMGIIPPEQSETR